jgi:CheY-like chemotaxis protein
LECYNAARSDGGQRMPHVLVLEDEPLIALMMKEWLEELGCETVGPAATVAKALDLIKGAPIDAALLDVTLRDQDCSEVAEVLTRQGVPFAFASGRPADHISSRYAQALSLPKPYDFEGVRKVMGRLLPSIAVG